MNKRIVRIGSRDSKLAVMQTELMIHAVTKYHPEIQFELVTMKTTGDIILNQTLDKIGGKGLFVKELDIASVSYTHLDVYKRQPMNSAKELLNLNKQEVIFYEAGNHQFYRSRKRFEHSLIQCACSRFLYAFYHK